MIAWIVLLTLAVVGLVAHHVWESRRESRWEGKIDSVLTGFRALENIVRGAISQREGIERDIEDHRKRIEALEQWRRSREGT